MPLGHLPFIFFSQMAVILTACRLSGWLNRRLFNQPQVVGEMIAGIVLGPSLLGAVSPQIQQMIFPPESLQTLYVGAQLGIGLFMFLVGLEFRGDHFASRARTALTVSIAGILVPFAFATLIAPHLLNVPGLFSEQVKPTEAVLFLGAAMSITAFPVLARLIHDNGLSNTLLGTLALSAGAIDDTAAWCVLAIVLASFGEGPVVAVEAIAGGVIYAVVVLSLGRRLLIKLEAWSAARGKLSHTVLGLMLATLMVCLSLTDFIGIHAVFGGFLLGVAVPRGFLARELRARLEPLVVVFLLPIFFTYSGLSTHLDLLSGGIFPLVGLMILGASILGKGVACAAVARLNGEDTPTALALGSLMNARGLMELILVNIGLQRGVIQTGLFSILVLMTVVTTVMATPLFQFFYRGRGAGHELQPRTLSE